MSPDKYRYPNNEGTLRAGIDGFLLGFATAIFVMLIARSFGVSPLVVGSLGMMTTICIDVAVVWYSPSTPFGR